MKVMILAILATVGSGYEFHRCAPPAPHDPGPDAGSPERRICEEGEPLCPCPDTCEDPCWCDLSCSDCGCPGLPDPVCG